MKQDVNAQGGEFIIKSGDGHYAVIRKEDVESVQAMLDAGDHEGITKLVNGYPMAEDYAEDGSLYISDKPEGEPKKEEKPLLQKASKVSNFMEEWFGNPETKEKIESFAPGLSDKIMGRLKSAIVMNMDQLKDQKKYRDYWDFLSASKDTKRMGKMQSLEALRKKAYNSGAGGTADEYSNSGWIAINNDVSPNPIASMVHELTHISFQNDLEKQLLPYKNKRLTDAQALEAAKNMTKGKNISNLEEAVKQNRSFEEGGIYPRLMETRFLLDVKPGEKITKEHLNDPVLDYMGSPLQGLRMNYDDDTLIEILNTVAGNKANTENITGLS